MNGTILTIGYHGSTPETLFATLRAAGCRLVVDVRAAPWSRRAMFTKQALRDSAPAVGLAYVHLPGLGNPAKSNPTGGSSLTEHLASPVGQAALAEAARLLRDHGTLALLCLERDPATCHRTAVAAALSTLTGAPVRPLIVSVDPRPEDPQQGDLFG